MFITITSTTITITSTTMAAEITTFNVSQAQQLTPEQNQNNV